MSRRRESELLLRSSIVIVFNSRGNFVLSIFYRRQHGCRQLSHVLCDLELRGQAGLAHERVHWLFILFDALVVTYLISELAYAWRPLMRSLHLLLNVRVMLMGHLVIIAG